MSEQNLHFSPGIENSHTPQTVEGLKSQACVGALLAIFGCGDSLIRLAKLDKRLHQKMGISALQRMYNEADRMNRSFEKLWNTQEGDHMNYLHADAAIIMLVLASVDAESRTNLSNEFRRVWGQLLEGVGDTNGPVEQQHIINMIRFDRGLSKKDPLKPDEPTDVFDHLSFNVGGEKKELQVPRVPLTAEDLVQKSQEALNAYMTGQEVDFLMGQAENVEEAVALEAVRPNCMVFVRDKFSRQLLAADVVVKRADLDAVMDRFAFDPDGLFERQYPVQTKLVFSARADGYLYGGCDQFFYEDDEAQLVVNILLTPNPVA